jgi:hypothetical protein
MNISKEQMKSWVSGQIDILYSDNEPHTFPEGLSTIVSVHYHGEPDEQERASLPGQVRTLAYSLWPNEQLAELIATLQKDLDKRLALPPVLNPGLIEMLEAWIHSIKTGEIGADPSDPVDNGTATAKEYGEALAGFASGFMDHKNRI